MKLTLYFSEVIDVTCALIIDDKNRLFAAQRSETMALPLKWELPGGKIEQNESPEDCIVREIHEEINIKIKIIKSITSSIHNYPNITINLIPFVCKIDSGEISLREHVDFKWLNKNELLDLDWAEADIPIINTYLKT